MLRELLYDIDCDTCHGIFKTGVNPFRLQTEAEAAGWKLRRRKDGRIARSGGKDYCPSCAKTAGFTLAVA